MKQYGEANNERRNKAGNTDFYSIKGWKQQAYKIANEWLCNLNKQGYLAVVCYG